MKQLLAEKYRPKDIESYVFTSDQAEKSVKKWISQGEIPNVLLSGTQGTGKSTLARLLIQYMEVNNIDVKYVNASLKGVDFIRNELTDWLQRACLSKFKVVYLEEMNRFREDAQKTLYDLTESYSDRVRFIGTTNYPEQLTPALFSRFQHIGINELPRDQVIDLICDILEAEGIEPESEEAVLSHIDAYIPDVRKIINSIDQDTSEDGILAPVSNAVTTSGMDEWEHAWKEKKAVTEPERLLELSEAIDDNNYEWFYQIMYTYHNTLPDPATGLPLISEYLDRSTRSANQRLHLDALIYRLFFLEED